MITLSELKTKADKINSFNFYKTKNLNANFCGGRINTCEKQVKLYCSGVHHMYILTKTKKMFLSIIIMILRLLNIYVDIINHLRVTNIHINKYSTYR